MREVRWNARTLAACAAIAAGLLLVLEWAWVTDTERIEARLAAFGDAVQSRDAAAAAEVFADDFTVEDDGRVVLTKPLLAIGLAAALADGVVRRLDVREVRVSFRGDDAAHSKVIFSTTVKRDAGGFPGTAHVTFAWRRDGDTWRITAITDISDREFFFEWFGQNTVPLWSHVRRYTRTTPK